MDRLKNDRENPATRRAALIALGQRGITESAVTGEIRSVLARAPEVAVLADDGQVINGGFEELTVAGARGDEEGAFGETMFAPGSIALRNWSVSGGPITWREGDPSPAGGRTIELAPRGAPGCVAQAITTEAGAEYEVSFHTCTGREFAHFNRQVRIRIGDLDATIDCEPGATHARVTRRFRAVSPISTLTLCGVGSAGFGPMVDDVQVRRGNAR
jgi:hypothetical protein